MRSFTRSHLGLALAVLLVPGCTAQTPTPTGAGLSLGVSVSDRAILMTTSAPEGGTFVVRDDAPWAGLPEAARLPAGAAVHLDFFSRKPGGPVPQGANKVWYTDAVPFTVRFVPGAAFAVTDGDAADGLATVTVPQATYDAYVGTTGKPGGTVEVKDPIYFQKATLASVTTKPVWNRLGLRKLPLLAAYRRGDYTLSFAPKGLETGFSMRFVGATASAPLPPVPPSIQALSGPDTVAPGGQAALTAAVADLNADALTYTWSATGPAAATAPTGGATAAWTAPATPGLYHLGLVVRDPYFVSTADPTLPIAVEAPVAAKLGSATGGGWVLKGAKLEKVTFSFNARAQADGSARGTFQLVEGTGKTLVKTNGTVTALAVDGHRAVASGRLADGLTAFRFEAADLGEGAKAIGADTLKVQVDANRDGTYQASETRFAQAIAGGNIQVR